MLNISPQVVCSDHVLRCLLRQTLWYGKHPRKRIFCGLLITNTGKNVLLWLVSSWSHLLKQHRTCQFSPLDMHCLVEHSLYLLMHIWAMTWQHSVSFGFSKNLTRVRFMAGDYWGGSFRLSITCRWEVDGQMWRNSSTTTCLSVGKVGTSHFEWGH